MKLELKHLAPYLPYKLRVKNCFFKKHKEYILTPATIEGTIIHSDLKPILRPLSDLTKEIEVNGEVVVVADIIFPEEDYTNKFDRNVAIGALQLQNAIGHTCTFYQVVETLFKYHFDVFNLIDKGLAIDIKSLNP